MGKKRGEFLLISEASPHIIKNSSEKLWVISSEKLRVIKLPCQVQSGNLRLERVF